MNVKLSRLTITTLGSLANSAITVSHKPAYTMVANHVLLQKVEESYAAFFAVYGKKTYSGMGDSVAEGDLYRDEPYRALKTIIRGFTKVTGTPNRQEAIDLMVIIDLLGADLDTLDYASENEKLDKLISEYDKQPNQERLAKLNLTELYTTLKTRHADFKSMYFQQNEANAGLRLQSSASSLRTNLIETLRNYFALVTAMKSMKGWDALHAELNLLGQAANNIVTVPEKPEPVQQPTA